MAGSLNRATLIGYLGKDPEIRRTQDGRPIANLSIATSESWRDKHSGERREKTEWHRVVIFVEGLAKVAEQYFKKGSKVMVEGQIQTRKWTDQAGVEKYTTDIVLQGFDSKLLLLGDGNGGSRGTGNGNGGNGNHSGQQSGPNRSAPSRSSHNDDMDDDIPF
jgi:single-strand DNA-binding protein